METVNQIIEVIQLPAVVTFVATIITMFVNEKKLTKYGDFVTKILGVLNLLAGNVFANKNATDKVEVAAKK